ncbi:MAG: hypothetical protein JRK53_19370 [Deltaproteobacteria bacterium]|nr:hypothetical protein [Deltaproteobacteria bacterium]
MGGHLEIEGGVVETENLAMNSPAFNAVSRGTADLAKKRSATRPLKTCLRGSAIFSNGFFSPRNGSSGSFPMRPASLHPRRSENLKRSCWSSKRVWA